MNADDEARVYRLHAGDTVVVRAADGPWQKVTLRAKDFAHIERATAVELVAALSGLDGVTASDVDGALVLTSVESGIGSRVEVDTAGSSAAAPLGLLGPTAPGGYGEVIGAEGSGLAPARLTGTVTGPFRIPAKARMTVRVDGRGRRVTFDAASSATAQEVADIVNKTVRRHVARATGDGRVALVSPTVGLGSSLEVVGPDDPAVPDARAVLGLAGQRVEPYHAEPARLVCAPPTDATEVTNLTAGPVEVHLPGGPVVLPAGGVILLPRELAAGPVLRHLADQGSVRLSRPRELS